MTAEPLRPLTAAQVATLSEVAQVFVVDGRPATSFVSAHVPSSVWLSLDTNFEAWTPFVVNPQQGDYVVLVVPPGREVEAVSRLAAIGITSVLGFLDGGFDTWELSGHIAARTLVVDYSTVEEFNTNTAGYRIVDVRTLEEWQAGVLPTATLLTLPIIKPGTRDADDKNQHVLMQCGSGVRSLLATSVAERMGFTSVANLAGGMAKIKATGVPTGPMTQTPVTHL